jgi:hypothetical protein
MPNPLDPLDLPLGEDSASSAIREALLTQLSKLDEIQLRAKLAATRTRAEEITKAQGGRFAGGLWKGVDAIAGRLRELSLEKTHMRPIGQLDDEEVWAALQETMQEGAGLEDKRGEKAANCLSEMKFLIGVLEERLHRRARGPEGRGH